MVYYNAYELVRTLIPQKGFGGRYVMDDANVPVSLCNSTKDQLHTYYATI